MEMVAGEKVLLQSNNGSVALTTHRVRLGVQDRSGGKTISMTLDAVASCGLVTRSYPVFLVIALVAGIATPVAAVLGEGGAAGMCALVAVGFAVVYFGTRAGVLEIRSMGGDKIQVVIRAKHEEIVTFIDAVENAKLALLVERRQAVAARAAV